MYWNRRSIKTTSHRYIGGNRKKLPVEPTVTVMKADSHLQIDPSTVCVIDAKSALQHKNYA